MRAVFKKPEKHPPRYVIEERAQKDCKKQNRLFSLVFSEGQKICSQGKAGTKLSGVRDEIE